MTTYSNDEPVVLQFSETKRIATINSCGGSIRIADVSAFFDMIDNLQAAFQPVIHELVIMPSVQDDIADFAIRMADARNIPVFSCRKTEKIDKPMKVA